jgi:serine/threonine protein kinase
MKIGKMTVLGELGKGAGSRVYLVRRDKDNREYALKVVECQPRLRMRYLEQARNEYRIGCGLRHPNLIEIYCLETESGWLTGPKSARLLTQYAPGRTMDRLPLLPVPRLLRVFERIAAAVAFLHAQNIIHADLKPNNVILAADSEVKLIDYGIAQFRGERREHLHATREFMAPETGTQKLINERTDIYSFGATMYRLATLHAAPSALTGIVRGEREYERRYRSATTLNPRIPQELSELIDACLNFDPNRRPWSMDQVGNRLAHMVRSSDSPTVNPN